MTRADGGDLDFADPVGPVNNWLRSLFSQVDVYLNGMLVTPSTNTYTHRAYIETLLSYGNLRGSLSRRYILRELLLLIHPPVSHSRLYILRESLLLIHPPVSHSRRYILRESLLLIHPPGVTFVGTYSGESLSTVQPPGSLSLSLYGTSTMDSPSTVQLPGSPSRWYILRESLLLLHPPVSHSRRCILRGVASTH